MDMPGIAVHLFVEHATKRGCLRIRRTGGNHPTAEIRWPRKLLTACGAADAAGFDVAAHSALAGLKHMAGLTEAVCVPALVRTQ